jgi:transcriptional regulator with PAS, ATPase and Fis domain
MGVCKTLFARIIHSRSKRSNGPLIEVNCGAIPDNLLESELFGYESGAFTGARREGKIGLIALAQNGTLFLDEISELPFNLQVKLLRVIQDKTITKLGGTKPVKVDFHLITATNRDLKALIEKEAFREDLFYRLNVMAIRIPPLRDRKDDIFPLSLHFSKALNTKYGMNKSLAPSTIDRLTSYDWPGNIRELENAIERAVLTSDQKVVSEEFLPENIKLAQKLPLHIDGCGLRDALENVEREIILEAHGRYGTTVAVAKALGISQATAARKIKKYKGIRQQPDPMHK